MRSKWSVNTKKASGGHLYGKVMVDPPGFSPSDRGLRNADWFRAGGKSFRYGTYPGAESKTYAEAWGKAMSYATKESRIIKIEVK